MDLVIFFGIILIVVGIVVGALVWYVIWRCRKSGGVAASFKKIFLPSAAPPKDAPAKSENDKDSHENGEDKNSDVWPGDAGWLRDWLWYNSPESKVEVEAAKREMPILLQKMQLLEMRRMREATENQYRDQVFNRPNEKPSIIDAIGSIATTMSEHYGVEEFKLEKKELQDKIDACQEKIDRYDGLSALFGDDCEVVRRITLGPRLCARINDEIKQRIASREK